MENGLGMLTHKHILPQCFGQLYTCHAIQNMKAIAKTLELSKSRESTLRSDTDKILMVYV